MPALFHSCSGPIWEKHDWAPCFREQVLQVRIPLVVIVLSLLFMLVQHVHVRRRHKWSARHCSQLDPLPTSIEISSTQSSPLLIRALSTVILWKGTDTIATILRKFGRLRSSTASTYQLANSSSRPVSSPYDSCSAAALEIFHAENAVVLDEAHNLIDDKSVSHQDANSFRRRELGLLSSSGQVKKIWDLFGCTLSTVLAVISMEIAQQSVVWLIFWAYLTLLSTYAVFTRQKSFIHRAMLFAIALMLSISSLRSAILQKEEGSVTVLATIQMILALVTSVPSFLFPYRSKQASQFQLAKKGTQVHEIDEEIPLTSMSTEGSLSPIPTGHIHKWKAGQTKTKATTTKSDFPPSYPENEASLISRAFFGFVTPLLLKHYWTPFTIDAVPDLPPGSHAASVIAAFRSSRISLADQTQGNIKMAYDDDDGEDASDSTFFLLRSHETEKLGPSSRPLRTRLFLHFLPLYVLQILWATVEAISTLTPPIFLHLILVYISQRSDGQQTIPLHIALTYALGLALGQVIASVSAAQGLYIGRTICIRLRAVLLFEIVNKALRRRNTGGGDEAGENDTSKERDRSTSSRTTDGELNNLVAVDVFKVSEVGSFLHFLFPQAPLEIIICVFLLFQLLGYSALAGVAILVLSVPLQTLTAKLFVKMQKRLLEAVDRRLELTNEILICIKTVKFFAWEKHFERRLDEAREKELRLLSFRCVVWLLSIFVYLGLPMMVTLVTFALHTAVFHRPLPAETAFTALALFNALRHPLDALPDMIVNMLTVQISLGRVDHFLREEETTKYEQLVTGDSSLISIGFSRATFTYSEDDEVVDSGQAFCLRNLDLRFPEGKLSVIAGPVGSGKTTLLMSLLGETRQLSGKTFMPCVVARDMVQVNAKTGLSDTVAYCSQVPWLLGTTVKDNILFGQQYDDRRYRDVLQACALEADLQILEYHDDTEVGEKGTSLSGGQKARLSLARALYSSARYLLIDDALSAVDAHTAEHLYHHCITGPLIKDRTVILVTHATSLCLPGAAYVVAMRDGKVEVCGSPLDVTATGKLGQDISLDLPSTQHAIQQGDAPCRDWLETKMKCEETTEEAKALEEAETTRRQNKKALYANEETYGRGGIDFKSYRLYLSSFAPSTFRLVCFWVVAIALFASSRSIDVANASWLRQWASTYDEMQLSVARLAKRLWVHTTGIAMSAPLIARQVSAELFQSNDSDHMSYSHVMSIEQARRTRHYLTVYGLLVVAYLIFSFARDGLGLYGSLQASRALYRRLSKTIVQAKPQWFDRTPIGRIMNRLSKDIETVDQELSAQLIFMVDVTLQTIIIMLVACYAVPAFTIIAILVSALYWLIGALYVVSSRDLKRIESVSRSPIFTLVGEVLSGVVTIRAFGDASRFTRHCLRLIDKSNRPFYFLWAENRWLSIRVDGVATIVSLVMSLFLILTPTVDAALAGFALSFTIQLVNAVLWLLRTYTTMEINANSVERIGEYLEVESEDQGGIAAPAAWPSRTGSIKVEDLCVRYSAELPLVLNGVSFTVLPGEKVGICGRTGSGKSSLALALFRFLEAESGRIVIDGHDIKSICLEDIRSRLTVIPQEAQLFSGTIRSNMDPFGHYEDEQLWDALQRCQLASTTNTLCSFPRVAGTPSALLPDQTAVIMSLDMPVEQGGKNFSAGQRQLLVLARGLLKISRCNSNIVILDESTASLDQNCEERIQRTIENEMRDATMLTIAHRLRGIIIYDKVLVLDVGQVLEYDRPSTLLQRPESAFYQLCARSGELDVLIAMADKADDERNCC